MPSKTLIWTTHILHLARKAEKFGLIIPECGVDMQALRKRKRQVVEEFASFRRKQLESSKYSLIRSQASFIDSHTIELDDGRHITAKNFIIATGSRVSVPPIPGLAQAKFWTSDDILDLGNVPESIIVLGGGVVACELAQFLARIGSKVSQIQRSPRVLKEFSPEASEAVSKSFKNDGIALHTDTQLVSVQHGKGHFIVRFKELATGKLRSIKAKHLLNSLGREPNLSELHVEKAGIKLAADGGIKTNRWQQSSQTHIYAGGDVCGPHEIVHLAVAQGELAARHALGIKGLKPVDTMPLLSVVFTDPQVASVGATERELVQRGTSYVKASYPFNDHGKSILMDEMLGQVSLFAQKRDGKIIGAEITGPDAGELIHCLTVPISMGASAADLLKAPWYHPTLAEIIGYPLEDIAEQIDCK